ncbi:MAG: hypothetical protein ACLT98_08470 [Eggerthellaceae bacterium]
MDAPTTCSSSAASTYSRPRRTGHRRIPEIVPYQCVLTAKARSMWASRGDRARFSFTRLFEDLRRRLAAELKSNLQIAVDIKIVEPKTIERSEGKAKRV